VPRVQGAGQTKTAKQAFKGTIGSNDPEHVERLFRYMRTEERDIHRAAFFNQMFKSASDADGAVDLKKVVKQWDKTDEGVRSIMVAGKTKHADKAMKALRDALADREAAKGILKNAEKSASEAASEAGALTRDAVRMAKAAERAASVKPRAFPLSKSAYVATGIASIPAAYLLVKHGHHSAAALEVLMATYGANRIQRWITGGHALTVARALKTPPNSKAWPKVVQALGVASNTLDREEESNAEGR
jgi:hypothetical protein